MMDNPFVSPIIFSKHFVDDRDNKALTVVKQCTVCIIIRRTNRRIIWIFSYYQFLNSN